MRGTYNSCILKLHSFLQYQSEKKVTNKKSVPNTIYTEIKAMY